MKLNHILPLVFTITCRAAPASSSSSSVDVTLTKYVESASTAYDWSEDWIKNFPIHKSCNDSQFNQLSNALGETQILAAHARDHTARFGNLSKFYQSTLVMLHLEKLLVGLKISLTRIKAKHYFVVMI